LIGVLLCSAVYAAPFQNLDFEQSEGVLTGIPNWSIPEGVDYLHNAIFAGEGSVTLFDNSFPHGLSPLEGNQSVLMVYDPIGSDPPTGGVIFQTGDIPVNAVGLEMLVTDLDGIRVSLNDVPVPLTLVETIDGVQRVSGDVANFAGSSATLRIASPYGEPDHRQSAVDAIAFVVPEPATSTWTALAMLALIGLRRTTTMRR
jgi:hypothetical protein